MANLTQNEMKSLSSLFAKMDREDLDHAVNLHNTRSRKIIAENAAKFSIGDIVSFTGRGSVINATVEKINRKTVKVRDNKTSMRWSVSPSFLTLVS